METTLESILMAIIITIAIFQSGRVIIYKEKAERAEKAFKKLLYEYKNGKKKSTDNS